MWRVPVAGWVGVGAVRDLEAVKLRQLLPWAPSPARPPNWGGNSCREKGQVSSSRAPHRRLRREAARGAGWCVSFLYLKKHFGVRCEDTPSMALGKTQVPGGDTGIGKGAVPGGRGGAGPPAPLCRALWRLGRQGQGCRMHGRAGQLGLCPPS